MRKARIVNAKSRQNGQWQCANVHFIWLKQARGVVYLRNEEVKVFIDV
jgi:hypothetical protein